ncbi:MAG: helix-turn-helix domain-containing protein [Myxococcota bacterium]
MAAETTEPQQASTPRSRRFVPLNVVADRLGISMRTARRWAAKGSIPAKRFGAHWRVRIDELDDLCGYNDGEQID